MSAACRSARSGDSHMVSLDKKPPSKVGGQTGEQGQVSLTVSPCASSTRCHKAIAVEIVQVQQRETVIVFIFPLGPSTAGSILAQR